MAGDPSFFTLGVGEPDRARSFYGALFGWNFSDPPSGEGAVVEGCSVPGGIHGGDPGASPYLFFRADDLDAQLTRVRELGGDLAVHDSSDDPDAIARFGRFALCTDDQGSSFGLHKPPGGTSETDGAKGQLTFFELGVEDLERGRIFYEGLFGWSFMVGPGDGYLIKGTRVPGGVHGGDRGAAPYVFFRVDAMDAALERIRELGGTIEDMDIEGDEGAKTRFGRFKLCRDDQGSSFGLHEPPETA